MKFRLIPVVVALVIPVLAYYFYIVPSAGTVSGLEARVALASTQADTIAAGNVIRPRIARERGMISSRLVRVHAFTVPQAEARFLNDISYLAKSYGVKLVGVASKGKPMAFGAAATAHGPQQQGPPSSNATPLPALASAGANAPPLQSPLTMQSLADGVMLPRSVTITGPLNGVVRFIDGFGQLATPAMIGNITLAQSDSLHATFDVQVVVIDPAELRDAKQAKLPGTRLKPQGKLL
jgi:hypothetical protein